MVKYVVIFSIGRKRPALSETDWTAVLSDLEFPVKYFSREYSPFPGNPENSRDIFFSFLKIHINFGQKTIETVLHVEGYLRMCDQS